MTLEIIDLTINETTESRTTFTKSVKLSKYKSISKLWVEAFLTSPQGILGDGWYINSIKVNGQGVNANLGTQVNLKMFDSNTKGGGIKVIPNENNVILIGWKAPIGAGVISPHANITVKLRVEGETLLPGGGLIDSEILESGNITNITESLDKFADRATIPTIILFIGLGALGILLLFVLTRAQPVLEVAKELK